MSANTNNINRTSCYFTVQVSLARRQHRTVGSRVMCL